MKLSLPFFKSHAIPKRTIEQWDTEAVQQALAKKILSLLC